MIAFTLFIFVVVAFWWRWLLHYLGWQVDRYCCNAIGWCRDSRIGGFDRWSWLVYAWWRSELRFFVWTWSLRSFWQPPHKVGRGNSTDVWSYLSWPWVIVVVSLRLISVVCWVGGTLCSFRLPSRTWVFDETYHGTYSFGSHLAPIYAAYFENSSSTATWAPNSKLSDDSALTCWALLMLSSP